MAPPSTKNKDFSYMIFSRMYTNDYQNGKKQKLYKTYMISSRELNMQNAWLLKKYREK